MSNTATAAPAPAMETLRINLLVGRARAQLSQERLAERSSVERATISRIERGSANGVEPQALKRLAKTLDVGTPHGQWPSVPVARRYIRFGSRETWRIGRG